MVSMWLQQGECCSPELTMNVLNPLKALGTLLPCPVPAERGVPQAILASCPSISMDVHLFPLALSSHPQCAALGYAQLVSVSKTSLKPSVLPNCTCESLSGDC